MVAIGSFGNKKTCQVIGHGPVSAAGIEPATNGLKGQSPQCASPSQEPTLFTPVHWTVDEESLLDAYFKVCQRLCVQRTRLPTDVLAVFLSARLGNDCTTI